MSAREPSVARVARGLAGVGLVLLLALVLARLVRLGRVVVHLVGLLFRIAGVRWLGLHGKSPTRETGSLTFRLMTASGVPMTMPSDAPLDPPRRPRGVLDHARGRDAGGAQRARAGLPGAGAMRIGIAAGRRRVDDPAAAALERAAAAVQPRLRAAGPAEPAGRRRDRPGRRRAAAGPRIRARRVLVCLHR